MESDLIISKGGFPPLFARGCVQQLMPIEAGTMRRTIEGKLIYSGQKYMNKYRSIIYCEDKAPLAYEGFWRGSELRVGCIQRIWQKITGHTVILERDPVEGSVFSITASQREREVCEVNGRSVILSKVCSEESFVSYRPWLEMRVMNFSLMTKEWELKYAWRLELEEI